ncbi:hypothetical protein J5X84_12340 [Streptosporangiaceae bacterium NEAU-GS5]|nr:hypothetical protein [Streptosporangiaceae bacterium NEAU-GS5]
MSLTCARCGHQNVDGAQFCANPSCGAYLPWDRTRQPGTVSMPIAEQRAGLRIDLADSALTVDPGQTVGTTVTIHNTGTRVEQFRLRLFGPASAWGQADPAELAVYPGTKGTSTVRFTPPRSAETGAGRWDFGVLVESAVNSGLHADATGWLTVGTFSALKAELWPQVTRGRATTEHSVILDNQGNLPEVVNLSATDESGELRIQLPSQVTAGPGRTFVPVKVSLLTGQGAERHDGRTFRFSVTATPQDGTPVMLSGSRAFPAKSQPKPVPQPPPQPQVVFMPAPAAKKRGCLGGFIKLVVWLVIIAGLVAAGLWAYQAGLLQEWLDKLENLK